MVELILFIVVICIIIMLINSRVITNVTNVIDNDEKKCSNSYIYIKNSVKGGEFGRGVFANKDFNEGDVIEIGSLLVGTNENMFIGLYQNYVWNKNDEILLPLGFASICNHNYDKNSRIDFYDDFYNLVAIKNIKKNEEILVSYCNGQTKEECDKWFSNRNIKQI
jgi:hypothetical protein